MQLQAKVYESVGMVTSEEPEEGHDAEATEESEEVSAED
jgi:hypothetical protein